MMNHSKYLPLDVVPPLKSIKDVVHDSNDPSFQMARCEVHDVVLIFAWETGLGDTREIATAGM